MAPDPTGARQVQVRAQARCCSSRELAICDVRIPWVARHFGCKTLAQYTFLQFGVATGAAKVGRCSNRANLVKTSICAYCARAMRQRLPQRMSATVRLSLLGSQFGPKITTPSHGRPTTSPAASSRLKPGTVTRSASSMTKSVGRFNLAGIVRGPFQSAGLGYWMDRAYEGRGLASAAVRALVETGREALGLHRIEASTLLHTRPGSHGFF